MWIITEHGFISFVVDRKDSNVLHLRARLREDLERNFPGVAVYEKPGADYLFRAKVSKAEFAEQMTKLIMAATITSHFKDEAIRRSAVPKHGSRRDAYYALWGSLAKMQPYAPYSKTPRPEPVKKTYASGGVLGGSRQPGPGQQAIGFGTGGSRRASEFDWDANAWGSGSGVSHPDPVSPTTRPEAADPWATDEEFEAWWSALTDDERDEYLDAEEADLRRREMEEEFEAAQRALVVSPAPMNRPGSRRERRKARKGRKNRHNQERAASDQARYEQERRDGKHGSEARNRQAYLDKQTAERRRNGLA